MLKQLDANISPAISVLTFLPVIVVVIFRINRIKQPPVGSIIVAFLKVIPKNDIFFAMKHSKVHLVFTLWNRPFGRNAALHSSNGQENDALNRL